MLFLDTTFGIENGLHEDTATLKAEPIWGIQFHTVEIYVSALQLVFLEQPHVLIAKIYSMKEKIM